MAAHSELSVAGKHKPVNFPSVQSYEYLDHLSTSEKRRYEHKLQVLGTCDPYTAPAAVFISLKTAKSLPELHFGDVYIYLVETPSPYTVARMKAYKSTDSYMYFRSGWVNNAAVWEVKDKKFFIVKAKVNHSYRLNEPPLTAWVVVEKEGLVRFGHCTCMAGLGEVCSHVGAILYALLAAVNKLSGTACTDEACAWNEPSMAAVRTVRYAPGSQIAFTKAQRKRSADGCGDLPPAKIPPPTTDECTALYNMLRVSEDTEREPVKSSILSVVPGHAKRYIPRAVQLNIPASLNKMYKPQYRSLSHQELQAKSEEIFTELSITEEQCRVIQKETRLQSKCAMWFDQKAGRVTASNIRAACHTDPDKPAVSLLKKLCYPVAFKDPNNNTPHSLRWGIEHERKVVEEYTKMMDKFHTNLTVKKAGLVINPQYPWLGASPDGILTCDCHEMGVLEVKAPSSLQNSTLMEKCKQDSMFCLQEVEGKLSLKRDHQYFCQVQTQIHLTQASYCNFAFWGPGKEGKGEIHIERILPDTDFFDTMCEKVHIFVQKCVIPELVAKVFTAPVLPTSHDTSKPSESKGCYCGLPVLQNEDRLECKSGICKRQYIHRSCLKLDTSHSKMSSWKCSDCKREIAKQKKNNRKKNLTE